MGSGISATTKTRMSTSGEVGPIVKLSAIGFGERLKAVSAFPKKKLGGKLIFSVDTILRFPSDISRSRR